MDSENNKRITGLIRQEVKLSLPRERLKPSLEKRIGPVQAETLIEEERKGVWRFMNIPRLYDFFMGFQHIQELESGVLTALTDFIDTYSDDDATLVQVGCKTGLGLRVLSALKPKLHLIGYDENKGMIRRARRKSSKSITFHSYPLEEEQESFADVIFERTELNAVETTYDFLDRMFNYSYRLKQGGWLILSSHSSAISDYVNKELAREGFTYCSREPIAFLNNEQLVLYTYRLLNHVSEINFEFDLHPSLISPEDILSFYKIFASEAGFPLKGRNNGLLNPRILSVFLDGEVDYFYPSDTWSFAIWPDEEKTSITLTLDSDSRDLNKIYTNLQKRYLLYIAGKWGLLE